jgi:hypothetical protein
LPEIDAEVGIIAGDRCVNPLFGRWIGSPNDGKVAVGSTRLANMRDHITVRSGHTLMPWRALVLEQVFAFLETGRFRRRDRLER